MKLFDTKGIEPLIVGDHPDECSRGEWVLPTCRVCGPADRVGSGGGCCTVLKRGALGEVGAVCSKTKPRPRCESGVTYKNQLFRFGARIEHRPTAFEEQKRNHVRRLYLHQVWNYGRLSWTTVSTRREDCALKQ